MIKNLPTKYIEFIEECKMKNYETQHTHKHHILPRFMGGTDDVSNLVELSVSDHFEAHRLLAELCKLPNHKIGNKLASSYLVNRYDNLDISKEEIGKLISEAKKEYYKYNDVWNKGKSGLQSHTTDSLKKISNSLKEYYKYNDVWNKNKKCVNISNSLKGWHLENENPFKGKTHSVESKLKMSKNHADFSGNKNPSSRKCIDLNTNTIYGCIKEMANSVGVPRTTMNRWVKDKRKTQFKYIEENE